MSDGIESEKAQEIGIDIPRNTAKSVFGLYKTGAIFADVIAVCHAEAARRCPTFPGMRAI